MITTNNVTMLPVGQLKPNSWNPNQMSDAEYAALVAEVRRLGRLPKPIVVRPQGEQYEIVDGEHGWQAAQEVGLTEVPCEVIDADDYEAMRQTYRRNQHGQHSPVREGRMFWQMRSQKEMTNAALARELGVTEGTIRNKILYAEAAAQRNHYADEVRDDEIDGLQIRQVRTYLDLSQTIGDLWLDAGGQMGLLGRYAPHRLRRLSLLLVRHGFVEFLMADDFRGSFARLTELAEWLEQHADIAGAADYVRLTTCG